jgi:RNA polymerase sigma-70 factor (ECF subfamily)
MDTEQTAGGTMGIREPIERLQTERDSFDRLLRPELASAYRLAGYLLCDAGTAEDAAQEAVLRAWRAYPTLRDHSQFGPWLQRIVANVCRDQQRRRRLVRFVPLEGAPEEPQAGDPFRASLDRVAIGRAIAQLSSEHREVVVMRYMLDLTNEAIGERLGIPVGTVKSRLHYAFTALRRSLDRDPEVAR